MLVDYNGFHHAEVFTRCIMAIEREIERRQSWYLASSSTVSWFRRCSGSCFELYQRIIITIEKIINLTKYPTTH